MIAFDNRGSATTGVTPHSLGQMVDDAIVFVDSLGLGPVDLLGATATLYPDSAHGFPFQHAQPFAADVHKFLDA